MPTVVEIINLYPIAQYLAANEIPKEGLPYTDIILPEKIYNIGKSVLNRYNADPTDTTLTKTANYLYALCGIYGIQAQRVTGTAGNIAHTSTAQVPDPYNFIVDTTTSFILDGASSKIITAFIGYNILFSRNGIVQSNLSSQSSYFNWNKLTGLFVISPAAVDTELFVISAI